MLAHTSDKKLQNCDIFLFHRTPLLDELKNITI